MNGINLTMGDKGLRARATQSYFMIQSAVSAVVDIPALKPPGVIIPHDTAEEIAGLKGDVTVRVDAHKIEVRADGLRLISKMIDSKFPGLDPLLAGKAGGACEVDAAELKKALVRLASMTDPVKGFAMRLEWHDDRLVMSLPHSDGCLEEIDAVTAGPGSIGVSGAYLQKISALFSERIGLGFTDGAPALRITGTAEPGIFAVVAERRDIRKEIAA